MRGWSQVVVATSLVLVGCGGPIQLRYSEGEVCPFANVPYHELTLRINTAAVEAVAEDGRQYPIFWPEGFRGKPGLEPAVLDSTGQLVAQDGEVIAIPDEGQGFPELRGYRVCASGDALYVVSRNR